MAMSEYRLRNMPAVKKAIETENIFVHL